MKRAFFNKLLTLIQPSSPESGQPRKRRRVGNPFVDLEAAADHDEEEDEQEDESVPNEHEGEPVEAEESRDGTEQAGEE